MIIAGSKSILNPKSIHPKLLFREDFRNEQQTIALGGVSADVSFVNGKGVFNGNNSTNIVYEKFISKSSKSFRVRFTKNGVGSEFGSEIIVNDCSADEPYVSFTIEYNEDSKPYLAWATTSNLLDTQIFNYVLEDDVEYEIVAVFESTQVSCYINGNIVSTETGKSVNFENNIGDKKIYIGGNFRNQYLKGTIDLLEIYEGTLTASEIANLYKISQL
jgi:hypothetical protein